MSRQWDVGDGGPPRKLHPFIGWAIVLTLYCGLLFAAAVWAFR